MITRIDFSEGSFNYVWRAIFALALLFSVAAQSSPSNNLSDLLTQYELLDKDKNVEPTQWFKHLDALSYALIQNGQHKEASLILTSSMQSTRRRFSTNSIEFYRHSILYRTAMLPQYAANETHFHIPRELGTLSKLTDKNSQMYVDGLAEILQQAWALAENHYTIESAITTSESRDTIINLWQAYNPKYAYAISELSKEYILLNRLNAQRLNFPVLDKALFYVAIFDLSKYKVSGYKQLLALADNESIQSQYQTLAAVMLQTRFELTNSTRKLKYSHYTMPYAHEAINTAIASNFAKTFVQKSPQLVNNKHIAPTLNALKQDKSLTNAFLKKHLGKKSETHKGLFKKLNQLERKITKQAQRKTGLPQDEIDNKIKYIQLLSKTLTQSNTHKKNTPEILKSHKRLGAAYSHSILGSAWRYSEDIISATRLNPDLVATPKKLNTTLLFNAQIQIFRGNTDKALTHLNAVITTATKVPQSTKNPNNNISNNSAVDNPTLYKAFAYTIAIYQSNMNWKQAKSIQKYAATFGYKYPKALSEKLASKLNKLEIEKINDNDAENIFEQSLSHNH